MASERRRHCKTCNREEVLRDGWWQPYTPPASPWRPWSELDPEEHPRVVAVWCHHEYGCEAADVVTWHAPTGVWIDLEAEEIPPGSFWMPIPPLPPAGESRG